MTQTTAVTMGALQFDDVNQMINIPFTVSNEVLGVINKSQSVPYAQFAAAINNPDWQTTMPYSAIKSSIQSLITQEIGSVVVG